MDATMLFDMLFAMMVVPCVALLAYGAWLSWCELARKDQSERAYDRRSATAGDRRVAAISPRPGPALRRAVFLSGGMHRN